MPDEKKIMLPAAYAIILNDKHEVLLVKRSMKSKYAKGMWQLPGGRLEFGESFLDALKREIMEELGCEFIPSDGKVISTASAIIEWKDMKINIIANAYKGRINGSIRLDEENMDFGWFKISDALDLTDFEPATRQLLADSGEA